ncbi:transposase [Streptomyces sp. SID13726]|nr:transposase [Streptomyces sp. SID13726]
MKLRDEFEGVIWHLRSGAQWREMPEEFGPRPDVYGRFRAQGNRTGRMPETIPAAPRTPSTRHSAVARSPGITDVIIVKRPSRIQVPDACCKADISGGTVRRVRRRYELRGRGSPRSRACTHPCSPCERARQASAAWLKVFSEAA